MFRSLQVLGSLCLLILVSCGEPVSKTKNIFGEDSRFTIEDASGWHRAIGRVDSGCSAFLIAKNLVGTAAHCVVKNSDGSLKTNLRYFETGFIDGEPSVRSKIKNAWIGSFSPEDLRMKDWAVLEIEEVDTGVFLDIEAIDFSAATLPFAIELAGFQADRDQGDVLSKAGACSIRSLGDEGRLLNDCDSYAGVSGAPIVRDGLVVGLAVSEFRGGSSTSVRRDVYSEDYANVAIPVNEFLEVAAQLKNSVGRGETPPDSLAYGFALEVPDRPDPANQSQISLFAESRFTGGTFRDNSGQIVCRGDGENCSATYENGTEVVLTAPRSLRVNSRTLYFSYWVCNQTTENFPRGVNLCTAGSAQCSLRIQADLICSAMYR